MKPKVLVVDDKAEQRDLAKQQLSHLCDLTVVGTFSVAKEMLKHSFDAVLTDVMLIGESGGISPTHPEIGKEVPYGLIIAIVAHNFGSKVAMVTDLNHHSSPIAYALDEVKEFENGIICNGQKNWLDAFHNLFPEIDLTKKEDEEVLATAELFLLAGLDFPETLETFKKLLPPGVKTHSFVGGAKKILDAVMTLKPTRVLIFAELAEKAPRDLSGSDIKEILEVEKNLDTIIKFAGWMNCDAPDFIQLPFLADVLKEAFEL